MADDRDQGGDAPCWDPQSSSPGPDTVASLLNRSSRQPRFGFYDAPVGSIDPDDFDLRSPMGGVLDAAERRNEFRQFQFLGAISESVVIGCALTRTHALNSAFAYIYRPEDQAFHEIRLRSKREVAMSLNPDDGMSEFVGEHGSVRIEAQPSGVKRLRIEHPDVDVDLQITETGFETLRLCSAAGPTGWAYAQKVAGVPAAGSVRSPVGDFDLAEVRACGHHDYTAGFLQPETWWNWACISGRDADGRLIGVNVSRGVNQTSFSENCFWVDGVRTPLGGTHFEFDPDALAEPWEVVETSGRTHLTFTPAHGYHATGERGALATNFHQLFGTFSGELATPDGPPIVLRDIPGFAESQYARW